MHRASDLRARATARSTPKANTPCRSPAVPSRLLRRCRARTSRPRVVPPAVSSTRVALSRPFARAASSRPCAAPARSPSPRRSASSPRGMPPRTSRATSTPRSSPTTPCRSCSKSPTPRPLRRSPACRRAAGSGPSRTSSSTSWRYAPTSPDRLAPSPRRLARRVEARGRLGLFQASRARHVPEP